MTVRPLRFAARDKGALAANAAHGFAARHALVHYPSGAVCTYIPKNACSSLRLSLAMGNGCVADRADWRWIHANNDTFAASLRDLASTPYSFVLLRCPHARLASVFLDKIVGKAPPYWALDRILDGALDYEKLSFRRFVGLLMQPRLRMADHHWRPQAAFLVYQDYDDWFQVERMAVAAQRLQERIGLDLIDARPLTWHGTDRLVLDDNRPCADLHAPKLAAMLQAGRAPSHAALYDPALVALVTRLYFEDISLYTARFGPDDLLFPDAPAAAEDRPIAEDETP